MHKPRWLVANGFSPNLFSPRRRICRDRMLLHDEKNSTTHIPLRLPRRLLHHSLLCLRMRFVGTLHPPNFLRVPKFRPFRDFVAHHSLSSRLHASKFLANVTKIGSRVRAASINFSAFEEWLV